MKVLKRYIVLFVFLFHCAVFSQNFHGETPQWVKPCSPSLEPTPLKFWENHVQYLLSDIQKNWMERTTYHHFAMRIVTQEGVHQLSQIAIPYNPIYQKLVVHSLRVLRDNQVTERLPFTRVQELQREPLLEHNLYFGTHTVIYFLDDVREGDVVEYSYSLIGEHPFLTSHFSDMFFLQSHSSSTKQMYHRLLIDTRFSPELKTFNSSLRPQVTPHFAGVEEWTWEMQEPEPYFIEANQPSWHFPVKWVQLSQYKTWKEVIDKFLVLFSLPADLAANPGEEMGELVAGWCQESREDTKRALLALRFVQNKVRYFSFGEGMGAFQPSDPRIVLQRRFGDCKDKTFLLHAFLKLMGISSTPVVVNLNRGEVLPQLLPTPSAFDHIILKIEIAGKAYWVDPTWTHQGGTLETNAFPAFQWGLSLSPEATGLIPISGTAAEYPIEIHTTFKLTSKEVAQMTVMRKFQGAKADVVRNYLKWLGEVRLSGQFLDDIERIYGKSTFLSRSVQDDLPNNILTLTDSYQVPLQKIGSAKVLKVRPFTINHYLVRGFNPDRIAPLSLAYPLSVKEEIHIESPFNHGGLASDSMTQKHESFSYRYTMQKQGKQIDLHFDLHHLKDHVPLSSLQQYWSLTEEISQRGILTFEFF